MVLNKRSRLVRWAYWFFPKVGRGSYAKVVGGRVVFVREEGTTIPKQTSLCKFFWLAFLVTPLLSPFMLIIFGAERLIKLVIRLIEALPSPKPSLEPTLAQKITMTVSKMADRTANGIANAAASVRGWMLWDYIGAMKQRMCPIITFTDKK